MDSISVLAQLSFRLEGLRLPLPPSIRRQLPLCFFSSFFLCQDFFCCSTLYEWFGFLLYGEKFKLYYIYQIPTDLLSDA